LTWLLTVLALSHAFAHQDMVLQVSRQGEVQGTPERFGPIHIDRDLPVVRIGVREVTLPECVAQHFRPRHGKHMQVSASWYHDPAVLPPYLSVSFAADKKRSWHSNTFLFDLETGALIQVRVARDSPLGQPVLDLEEACTEQERKQLEPVRI